VVATRQLAKQLIWQWIGTPAPAIPVYTAPSNSWRESYVVLVSVLGTWAAMLIGAYAYAHFNQPRPTIDGTPAPPQRDAAPVPHRHHPHDGYHKLDDEKEAKSNAAPAPAPAAASTAAPASAAPAVVVVPAASS
jgi:hypothetical protein